MVAGELRRRQSLDDARLVPVLEEGAVVTELPCRRCGQVTPNRVIIWGADQTGALTAKAAQCRGTCPKETPQRQPERRRVRQRAAVAGSHTA
jgi:hypothetical protein